MCLHAYLHDVHAEERWSPCLFAMLRLLCPSVVCPSRATTLMPQLSLLQRATRSMSTSDRTYPKEPRVGVGVVILRPGLLQSQDTEVSRFDGAQQLCQQ